PPKRSVRKETGQDPRTGPFSLVRLSTTVTSPMGEDDHHQGYLAHGRGRPAPRSPRPWARTTSTTVTSPMGEDDQHHGHLAHGLGRPAPRSHRPWARTTSTTVTSPMGDDDQHHGEDDPRPVHLALGRGQSNTEPDRSHLSASAPRSPSPWARTTITKVTSTMGEDDQHHGHLAHGRGRPAPRPPRPWARTTSTTVTSPMGEDDRH
ncbi:hypothetical protein HID58_042600, partial [Brassica napus]